MAAETSKKRFVPVQVRTFMTIAIDVTDAGDEPTEAVLREIEKYDATDAIVRVRVKMLQSQETQLRTRDVEDALVAAHMIAGIAKDVQREVRSRIGLESAEALTPPQLLVHYLHSKIKSQEEIDELAALAREIMEQNA